MRFSRRLVRIGASSAYWLRRLGLGLLGIRRAGVHAVPVTGEGQVVLVQLTYAPGWRIPGGGRGRREDPEAAVLRELREEIGLAGHGRVTRVSRDPAELGDIFLVEDVVCRPRRTLEIEAVGLFDPAALPEDVLPAARREIEAALAAPRKA
ncbi:MAG TPA: NUDIX domain-containing protein [Allosphingosinicella sp.]|jgi:8-oxo-dGTP pyrophosphatase MutT (NUDIX family)